MSIACKLLSGRTVLVLLLSIYPSSVHAPRGLPTPTVSESLSSAEESPEQCCYSSLVECYWTACSMEERCSGCCLCDSNWGGAKQAMAAKEPSPAVGDRNANGISDVGDHGDNVSGDFEGSCCTPCEEEFEYGVNDAYGVDFDPDEFCGCSLSTDSVEDSADRNVDDLDYADAGIDDVKHPAA
eukprot:6176520-Pleurochrysis_carterae.AAC.2